MIVGWPPHFFHLFSHPPIHLCVHSFIDPFFIHSFIDSLMFEGRLWGTNVTLYFGGCADYKLTL